MGRWEIHGENRKFSYGRKEVFPIDWNEKFQEKIVNQPFISRHAHQFSAIHHDFSQDSL
jgi:hypothetical protein